jgi:beta-xylosidase
VVATRLSGLRPGTRYRFRLTATICGGCRRGTARSPVRTFRTRSRATLVPGVPAPRRPDAPPEPAVPAPPATGPVAAGYENPVAGSVADPAVIDAGRGDHDYFLYATGTLFPLWRSPDLVHWTQIGTALRARPAWTLQSGDWNPWAPGVLRSSAACPGTSSEECFVFYYTALHATLTPRPHCVGVAVSPVPEGPFTDLGPLGRSDGALDALGRPIGCGDDAGYGNIDPQPFVDADGRVYLYVSTDRQCDEAGVCVLRPTLSVIPLADDLLHASGPRTPLLSGDGGWEFSGATPLVENPSMTRVGSRYYLFYSGGDWRGAYGMGYAVGGSPTAAMEPSPFLKAPENPILRETDAARSSGGGMLVRGPAGGDWLIYHGRNGAYDQPRTLRIDPVVWAPEDRVQIAGPTTGPQRPAP